MMFEIQIDETGYPFLKKIFRERRLSDPRGVWVEIGKSNMKNINHLVESNRNLGYLVLQDEYGIVRALILTE